MSKQFVVKVYTPKGLVLEKSSEFLRIPGKSGDVGVTYDHTPSLLECKSGEMVLRTSNHQHSYFIPQALTHINKEEIIVILDFIEPVENIDKSRAEKSKERAEKRLADSELQQDVEIDINRAKNSLDRAQIRLDILAQKAFK